jgi:hypothetical protein
VLEIYWVGFFLRKKPVEIHALTYTHPAFAVTRIRGAPENTCAPSLLRLSSVLLHSGFLFLTDL